MNKSRQRTSKIVLRITCQLLWLGGLFVGLSGVYLLLTYRHSAGSILNVPAVLALLSAAFLFGSGAVGCWVSVRDSPFLQGLFVYLLIILLCLEATAAALASINSGKVDSGLAPFRGAFENYNGSSQEPRSNSVDAIQKELRCCGLRGFRDWLKTPWFNHTGGHRVPTSCCNTTFDTCNGTLDRPDLLYPQGCLVTLKEAILFVLRVIVFSLLVVAVLQIIGLISVAQLMRDNALQEYCILDGD